MKQQARGAQYEERDGRQKTGKITPDFTEDKRHKIKAIMVRCREESNTVQSQKPVTA